MSRNLDVAKMSVDDRKQLLERFFAEVIIPQRLGLLRSRELTWQSAFVDSDGYIAEMISSMVLGVPGVSRRGVTRTSGDLLDETEVKKGFRADPNVDFVVSGRLSKDQYAIEIDQVPEPLMLVDMQKQMNSNACSVQIVEMINGRRVGRDLFITRSRDSLVVDQRRRSAIVKLKARVPAEILSAGEECEVCIRQERGHINFGNKTRDQLRTIIRSRPVMVFYGHHLKGGLQIVVVRAGLSGRSIDSYLSRIYGHGEPSLRRQVQPYLYPDNVRQTLYSSDVHSVVNGLECRLLMVANERVTGLKIDYWDPDGNFSVAEKEAAVVFSVPDSEAPDLAPHLQFRQGDLEMSQQRAASWFFDRYIAGFYRSMEEFCSITSTTRNIGFGNFAQHLVSHVAGITGTRSGARGADLVESDGTPSEVKVATGEREGDAIGTEDMPRLTLGWDETKMLSWKRLFAVRIVDQGAGLRVLVHGPTEETMKAFRGQVRSYFKGRTNNGSGGLQYHASEGFPHDVYGPRGRQLLFERMAAFWEGKKATFH